MKSDNYNIYFEPPYLMGPNSIRLLDELLEAYPMEFTSDNEVLDLGCGTGITSMFIANETGATVYANDLWISAEDNLKRFAEWNMQDRLIPIQEDASNLHFPKNKFDAVISIDSYHYFAGKEGFFVNNILPYIKDGGVALIAIPGIKNEYGGRSEELLTPWLGEEAYMLQSADFWKHIIGKDERIEYVKAWEMSQFDTPWQEWFNTNHEYAINDKKYFNDIIKPYTIFIGIIVKKSL